MAVSLLLGTALMVADMPLAILLELSSREELMLTHSLVCMSYYY